MMPSQLKDMLTSFMAKETYSLEKKKTDLITFNCTDLQTNDLHSHSY